MSVCSTSAPSVSATPPAAAAASGPSDANSATASPARSMATPPPPPPAASTAWPSPAAPQQQHPQAPPPPPPPFYGGHHAPYPPTGYPQQPPHAADARAAFDAAMAHNAAAAAAAYHHGYPPPPPPPPHPAGYPPPASYSVQQQQQQHGPHLAASTAMRMPYPPGYPLPPPPHMSHGGPNPNAAPMHHAAPPHPPYSAADAVAAGYPSPHSMMPPYSQHHHHQQQQQQRSAMEEHAKRITSKTDHHAQPPLSTSSANTANGPTSGNINGSTPAAVNRRPGGGVPTPTHNGSSAPVGLFNGHPQPNHFAHQSTRCSTPGMTDALSDDTSQQSTVSQSSEHDVATRCSTPATAAAATAAAATAAAATASPGATAASAKSATKGTKSSETLARLYEIDDHPERRPFLDSLFKFMEDKRTAIVQCPTIARVPVDLFMLYFLVREKGGYIESSKGKHFKEISNRLGTGSTANSAYSLKKQYVRNILPFECHYERAGVDPNVVVANTDPALLPKAKAKAVAAAAAAAAAVTSAAKASPSGSSSPGRASLPPMSPSTVSMDQDSRDSVSSMTSSSDGHAAAAGVASAAPAVAVASASVTSTVTSASSPGPVVTTTAAAAAASTTTNGSGSIAPHYQSKSSNVMSNGHSANGDGTTAAKLRATPSPGLAATVPPTQVKQQNGPPVSATSGQASGQHSQNSNNNRASPSLAKLSSEQQQQNVAFRGGQPLVEGGSNGDAAAAPAATPAASAYPHYPNLSAAASMQQMQRQHPQMMHPHHHHQMQQQQHQQRPPMQGPPHHPHQQPPPMMPRPPMPPHMHQTPQPLLQHPHIPPPQQQQHQQPSHSHHHHHHHQQQQQHHHHLQHVSQFEGQQQAYIASLPPDGQCVESARIAGYRRVVASSVGASRAAAASRSQKSVTNRVNRSSVGPVPGWRLVMSLRSGLAAEATWALDVLNALTFDDSSVACCTLANMPGLLDCLVDHCQAALEHMFVISAADSKTASSEGKSDDVGSSRPERWTGRRSKCASIIRDTGTRSRFSHLPVKVKKSVVDPDRDDSDNENDSLFADTVVRCAVTSLDGAVDGWATGRRRMTEDELAISLTSEGRLRGAPRSIAHIVPPLTTTALATQRHAAAYERHNWRRYSRSGGSGSHNSSKDAVISSTAATRLSSIDAHMLDEVVVPEPATDRLLAVSSSIETSCLRPLAVTTLLRNLSFVPGNEIEMARNVSILRILGSFLQLDVRKQRPVTAVDSDEPNCRSRKVSGEGEAGADVDDSNKTLTTTDEAVESGNTDSCSSSASSTLWSTVHTLRENALVCLSNMAGHLDLATVDKDVAHPILDGLLTWAASASAYAQDPMVVPYVKSTSASSAPPSCCPPSPNQLAVEVLAKMSMFDANVYLIAATAPLSRLRSCIRLLSRRLAILRGEPPSCIVQRELAINVLYYWSGVSDAGLAYEIGHADANTVSLLLTFIEQAEHNAMAVAHQRGVHALRDNPDSMGTSLDMLRRAASTLRHLASHPDNATVIAKHDARLLALVMSQILDQGVAAILSSVLYSAHCYLAQARLTLAREEAAAAAATDDEDARHVRHQLKHRRRRRSSLSSSSDAVGPTLPSVTDRSADNAVAVKTEEASQLPSDAKRAKMDAVCEEAGTTATAAGNTASSNDHLVNVKSGSTAVADLSSSSPPPPPPPKQQQPNGVDSSTPVQQSVS